ncbi:hypothetical protein [Acetobacter sp.]|jgi:hypothetical protein|uniref:hypothetical protein n=1 Tax=Acetobacter sp. TaxID=440 RepID=UPI0025B98C77|nr:hypothetical protein [Acetobacter sp.]MCH4090144.1 hypothetical protein [Acetobacter sp.]
MAAVSGCGVVLAGVERWHGLADSAEQDRSVMEYSKKLPDNPEFHTDHLPHNKRIEIWFQG